MNEYFNEFTWAIPKAFKDPLSSCRFEQGDTLYDTTKAYETTWGEASKHIKYSIQIKTPLRAIAIKSDKDEDSMFSDNWNQTVTLDLTEYPSKTIRSISTTQGRLYTTLWKGNIELLERTSVEPSIPKLARDILAKDASPKLDSTVPYFLKQHTGNMKHPILFIIPIDEAQELLQIKYRNLEESLSKKFKPVIISATPAELAISNPHPFVPTLKIVCFIIDADDKNQVVAQLKDALYTQSKNRITTIDRFRLEAHGYLHQVT